MARIHIVNMAVGPKRAADYVINRNTSKTGQSMEQYVHIGQGKIQIKAYELPSSCALCMTEGRVVNYNVDGFHFRCLECGNKW